jgi:hypothetical protein
MPFRSAGIDPWLNERAECWEGDRGVDEFRESEGTPRRSSATRPKTLRSDDPVATARTVVEAVGGSLHFRKVHYA